MFIASFVQVTEGGKIGSDKNGNMPFIGNVLAGKATASIYNGTMFKRSNYAAGKLYLCQNQKNETTGFDDVVIISEVSTLEFLELRTKLGAGVLQVATANQDQPTEEAEIL